MQHTHRYELVKTTRGHRYLACLDCWDSFYFLPDSLAEEDITGWLQSILDIQAKQAEEE